MPKQLIMFMGNKKGPLMIKYLLNVLIIIHHVLILPHQITIMCLSAVHSSPPPLIPKIHTQLFPQGSLTGINN